jgi:hypothetical protein
MGVLAKSHPHPFELSRGRGWTVRPALPAPVIAGGPGADGGWGQGKRKRGARAIYSGAHLGRGRLEEVVPRQGATDGGGWWRRRKWWSGGGRASLLGEVWGGEGVVSVLL